MTHPIPDLLLEQLLCGDLTPAEREALSRRIAQDPDASARLDALRADNERLLTRYPAPIQAEQIRRRAQRAAHRSTTARRLSLIVAPLAAALLAVMLLPAQPQLPHDQPDAPDTVRIKGLQPGLRIFKKGAGEPALLRDEAQARAGDVLQVGWRARRGQHVAVLSLDGRGQITRHWPIRSDVTTPADEAEGMAPAAYQLDDAPELERFFLITSSEPIALPSVEDALRALPSPSAALTLPSPLNHHDLVIRKER